MLTTLIVLAVVWVGLSLVLGLGCGQLLAATDGDGHRGRGRRGTRSGVPHQRRRDRASL